MHCWLKKLSIIKDKKEKYFDGFWSSSLTDSTLFGRPDTESLDLSLRLNNVDKIFDVTSKPMIMDIDTGGKLEHLKMKINSIEKLGISAVIMEDKTGSKKIHFSKIHLIKSRKIPMFFKKNKIY